MKKITLLSLMVLLSICIFAENVDIERAKLVAKNFYFYQLEQLKGIKNEYVKVEDVKFSQIYELYDENNLLLYIINIENGFVIVSADDLVEPILGFSVENGYYDKDIPPALEDLLEFYKEQISYATKEQIKSSSNIQLEWESLSANGALKSGSCEIWPKYFSKQPLLTTLWNQNMFYNTLCPADIRSPIGFDGHVLAGCVALAMAQVMKYWNFPLHGTGQYTDNDHDQYNCPDPYGDQFANFGTTYYGWANMPNQLTAYNNSVSTLIYHCGISVDMDYGFGGSAALPVRVENELENHFSYNTSLSFRLKSNYTNSQWEDLLRNDIKLNQPIILSGWNSLGWNGHTFVLDGFSKTVYQSYSYPAYFHINWGWGGTNNGNYLLTDLTPGDWDFSFNQNATIGIVPSTVSFTAPPQPGSIHAACSVPYCMGSSYGFYVDPLQQATTYEWQITCNPPGSCGATITNPYENYVMVYAIRPSTSTLQVRALNHGVPGTWRTSPFVVTTCGIQSESLSNDSTIEDYKSMQNSLMKDRNINIDEIKIYPNPASNYISIYLSDLIPIEITLCEVNGISYKNIKPTSNLISINTNDLARGLYIIRIITNEGIETRKVQIIK